MRAQRFAGLDAAFAAFERGTELNEGLATYVELRAKEQETVDLPMDGFDATAVRRRAYSTGSALGILLDRFHPEWRESFEADDQQSLDGALRAALGVEPSELACAFSEDETADATRGARDDVARVLAERVEQREAFEAREGWRLVVQAPDGEPLWPQGFDPLNVARVDGGILHLRFLRLGNESGQIEALDTQEADIEALTESVGPHPLFNGVRRVVVLGLDEPIIEVEGASASIQTPGVSARFERAVVHESPTEVVVELLPTRDEG
ncbi:MAG: hypothetical protein AAGC60_19610 [Acidobacteriota bacterium]